MPANNRTSHDSRDSDKKVRIRLKTDPKIDPKTVKAPKNKSAMKKEDSEDYKHEMSKTSPEGHHVERNSGHSTDESLWQIALAQDRAKENHQEVVPPVTEETKDEMDGKSSHTTDSADRNKEHSRLYEGGEEKKNDINTKNADDGDDEMKVTGRSTTEEEPKTAEDSEGRSSIKPSDKNARGNELTTEDEAKTAEDSKERPSVKEISLKQSGQNVRGMSGTISVKDESVVSFFSQSYKANERGKNSAQPSSEPEPSNNKFRNSISLEDIEKKIGTLPVDSPTLEINLENSADPSTETKRSDNEFGNPPSQEDIDKQTDTLPAEPPKLEINMENSADPSTETKTSGNEFGHPASQDDTEKQTDTLSAEPPTLENNMENSADPSTETKTSGNEFGNPPSPEDIEKQTVPAESSTLGINMEDSADPSTETKTSDNEFGNSPSQVAKKQTENLPEELSTNIELNENERNLDGKIDITGDPLATTTSVKSAVASKTMTGSREIPMEADATEETKKNSTSSITEGIEEYTNLDEKNVETGTTRAKVSAEELSPGTSTTKVSIKVRRKTNEEQAIKEDENEGIDERVAVTTSQTILTTVESGSLNQTSKTQAENDMAEADEVSSKTKEERTMSKESEPSQNKGEEKENGLPDGSQKNENAEEGEDAEKGKDKKDGKDDVPILLRRATGSEDLKIKEEKNRVRPGQVFVVRGETDSFTVKWAEKRKVLAYKVGSKNTSRFSTVLIETVEQLEKASMKRPGILSGFKPTEGAHKGTILSSYLAGANTRRSINEHMVRDSGTNTVQQMESTARGNDPWIFSAEKNLWAADHVSPDKEIFEKAEQVQTQEGNAKFETNNYNYPFLTDYDVNHKRNSGN